MIPLIRQRAVNFRFASYMVCRHPCTQSVSDRHASLQLHIGFTRQWYMHLLPGKAVRRTQTFVQDLLCTRSLSRGLYNVYTPNYLRSSWLVKPMSRSFAFVFCRMQCSTTLWNAGCHETTAKSTKTPCKIAQQSSSCPKRARSTSRTRSQHQ